MWTLESTLNSSVMAQTIRLEHAQYTYHNATVHLYLFGCLSISSAGVVSIILRTDPSLNVKLAVLALIATLLHERLSTVLYSRPVWAVYGARCPEPSSMGARDRIGNEIATKGP